MDAQKFPQRAQTAGRHQECGLNAQQGAACRRHNELFVCKRFKATATVEEVTMQWDEGLMTEQKRRYGEKAPSWNSNAKKRFFVQLQGDVCIAPFLKAGWPMRTYLDKWKIINVLE
ncbi:uncharacterized protein LOC144084240 [Stigmatopora argus]